MVLTTGEILAQGHLPRRCDQCGQVKTNDDFALARRRADGRNNICRECTKRNRTISK